jgi:multiple sugar transport system permease protein
MCANHPLGLQILVMTPSITNSLAPAQGLFYGDPIYGYSVAIDNYIDFRKVGWIGTFYPLIVPAFFGNVLYVFLLRQFLLTIPKELSDAARIDGASELGIFWYIMVPLLKPALATVALFTFVTTFRDFLGPLIYLTDQNQWTISLGLKLFQNQYGAQWQLMMAAATLTMLPILILFFFTQRTFTEGIALTGVKG